MLANLLVITQKTGVGMYSGLPFVWKVMARPERFELPTFWFVVGEVSLVSCGLSCPYNLADLQKLAFRDKFCSLNVPKSRPSS